MAPARELAMPLRAGKGGRAAKAQHGNNAKATASSTNTDSGRSVQPDSEALRRWSALMQVAADSCGDAGQEEGACGAGAAAALVPRPIAAAMDVSRSPTSSPPPMPVARLDHHNLSRSPPHPEPTVQQHSAQQYPPHHDDPIPEAAPQQHASGRAWSEQPAGEHSVSSVLPAAAVQDIPSPPPSPLPAPPATSTRTRAARTATGSAAGNAAPPPSREPEADCKLSDLPRCKRICPLCKQPNAVWRRLKQNGQLVCNKCAMRERNASYRAAIAKMAAADEANALATTTGNAPNAAAHVEDDAMAPMPLAQALAHTHRSPRSVSHKEERPQRALKRQEATQAGVVDPPQAPAGKSRRTTQQGASSPAQCSSARGLLTSAPHTALDGAASAVPPLSSAAAAPGTVDGCSAFHRTSANSMSRPTHQPASNSPVRQHETDMLQSGVVPRVSSGLACFQQQQNQQQQQQQQQASGMPVWTVTHIPPLSSLPPPARPCAATTVTATSSLSWAVAKHEKQQQEVSPPLVQSGTLVRKGSSPVSAGSTHTLVHHDMTAALPHGPTYNMSTILLSNGGVPLIHAGGSSGMSAPNLQATQLMLPCSVAQRTAGNSAIMLPPPAPLILPPSAAPPLASEAQSYILMWTPSGGAVGVPTYAELPMLGAAPASAAPFSVGGGGLTVAAAQPRWAAGALAASAMSVPSSGVLNVLGSVLQHQCSTSAARSNF